ncbi:SGNH/GDSL hydrolase family protein [uncultured Jatrophihabitans sp.]|uniref:SGNH/GDSL hydrolase family protein n=1 Tax=uncultured Jatrophihabitans sp. TaxID=1610747 RepID=UPI0035CC9891
MIEFPGGRPPRPLWPKILGGVVLVAVVATGAYIWLRPKAAPGAGTTPPFSPPTSQGLTQSSSAPARPLRVVILRGGTTGCQPSGGCGDNNYAAALQFKTGWSVTTLAKGGSGYVGRSLERPPQDFGARLTDVYSAKPDVVIVEGSVSDQQYPESEIQGRAVSVFTRLKANLPKATVIAVGPAYSGRPPAGVRTAEQAVKAAARGRIALFVDPIAGRWFDGANAKFMGADHESPNNEGHSLFAAKLLAALQTLHLRGAA